MKYLLAVLILSFPMMSFAASDAGKKVYTANCVTCHGDKGDGQGPAGKYMNPKPRNFTAGKSATNKWVDLSEKGITTATKNGLKGTGMPGFGHLSDAEIKAVVEYVQTFMKK